MIERRIYIEHYWNPYLLCERDFLEALDYVALRKRNFPTCSEKFIRSLLTTCELFESTIKAMYDFEEKKPSYPNFVTKINADPLINANMEIHVNRGAEEIALTPFAGIDKNNPPKWWSCHNAIKHNRYEQFEKGNLENTLNALAALYYIELVFAKHIGDWWCREKPHDDPNTCDVPNDLSHLFSIKDFKTRHVLAGYETYFMTSEETDEIISRLQGQNPHPEC